MKLTLRTPIVMALFGFFLASPAFAGERDFILYAPGVGGTADTARPFIDAFSRYLEKERGWPARSSNGIYIEDAREAARAIVERKPGFGLIPAWLDLELSCGKDAPQPVAAVDGIAGMSSAVRFHVVVKRGGAKTLADLKGKTLVSNHLENHKYVSRVLFGGKVDIDTFFKIKETKSPVRPFTNLISGEADAALVSDDQLKNKPAELDLVTLFSSEPQAPFPLVAFPAQVKPAERDAVQKVLVAMCSTPAGAKICSSLQISRFVPLDAGAYQGAVQLYCKQ